MNLFDYFERTEQRSGYNSEPSFVYTNLSARPSFVAIRQVLEEWFSRYPEEGKKDLRGRFRSKDNDRYISAFFELFLHEYFLRLGFELIVHPDIAGTSSRPDFLVRRGGRDCFYLEATAPQSRQVSPADAARLDKLHDALQQINSPDFFLDVSHYGYPRTDASVKSLIKGVERWLPTLKYEEVQRGLAEGGLLGLPVFRGDVGGLVLEFRPIPKSERSRGKNGLRPIGMFGPAQAQMVDTTSAIRLGALAKRKKYGEFKLPYVIAMNVCEMFISMTDVVDALFGREAMRVSRSTDRSEEKIEYIRTPDSLWLNERGPVNKRISAVFVFLQMKPWSLASVDSALAYNPFAVNPLTEPLPPKKIIGEVATGKLSESPEERSIAEVLNLPMPWPVIGGETID